MERINRIFRFNNIIGFNLRLGLPILFLCVIGLIALNSTSLDTLGQHSVFYKQCIWILCGLLVFVLFQFLRNQVFYEFSYIFYIVLLLLIGITLFMPAIPTPLMVLLFVSKLSLKSTK